MKRNFLTLVVFAFSILILSTLSWAQCPEDPNDQGECDTLIVTCLDCEIDITVPEPYFVHFPLLVTHDQTDAVDSIAGFAIPLGYTHTNPSAYCSVSAWWNNTKLFPSTKRVRSIFRHITDPVSGDTLVHNRMMSLSELEEDLEWDTFILNLDGISRFWLSMIPVGVTCRRWWEGDRVLLATMTFRIEDTMHVCIDTTLQPPTTHVKFSRSDGQTYTPRHNMPKCFWVGPPGQPDFTIEATPDTQTVQAGQSTNYDVTLTSLFGFDSPCNLSATGLPDDATADFDPNPVTPTGTSVMSIGTAETTPPGPYEITITATEVTKAQIVHDTTVVLVVTPPPDFTIEATPDTQTVQAGQSTNYDVTLTSLFGFDSPCTLTVTGLPAGADADFSPNPLVPTGSSIMNVNTSAATTPPGTYNLTITATELTKTQIMHDTTVVLVVTEPSDFTIEVEPDTQEVQVGDAVNFDVILTSLYGFASPCTLTVSGLPPDASGSFDPNPVIPTDTSNLQINTAVTTPPDTYTVTVTASEVTKGIVHDAEFVLIVTPLPDFTIEATPDTQTVQVGQSTNYDVTLTSLFGFDSPCTLTVTGLPAGADADFSPNPLVPTGSSIMNVNTSAATTPPGTYNLTITATELTKAEIVHDTTVVLVVTPPPDFTIEASPETLEVSQGDEGSYEVILTSLYGFDSACTLEVSGLPQYASGEFDPDTLVPTDTSALTIAVADTTLTGTYPLTITATELVPVKGQVEHSIEVFLVVSPPEDFAIEVFPDTLRLHRGNDSSYTVVLTSISGFNSPCTLTVTGLPEEDSAAFDSPVLIPTDTTKLNIYVPDTADTGTHILTITATEMVGGKAIQHSEEVTLIVTFGTWTFYVDVDPDTQKVVVGDSTTYKVTIVPYTGLTPCTLSIEGGFPPGATFSFDPEVISPNDTSILTIFTTASTPAGKYDLTIKATVNPKQWDTTTAILMVQDFTISAAPDTQYVTQGYAVGYEVKLTSLFGFDEPCTLLVSGLPDPPDNGVFDQVTLIPTDSTTLTVYTSTETDTIWYTLTITAQRMPGAKPDGLERSIQVMLKVNPSTDAGDWADNPNAPKSFALFQNQPNPFNPETKISYYLPRACQLRLTIYNVLGQRVRTLFDGHQDAGIQILLWDGRDDAGVQLGSGIYFYRLQADEFHQTKKMTLVK